MSTGLFAQAGRQLRQHEDGHFRTLGVDGFACSRIMERLNSTVVCSLTSFMPIFHTHNYPRLDFLLAYSGVPR